MKRVLLFLSITFFGIALSASNIYVKVDSSSNRTNVENILYTLNDYGYKMYVTESQEIYNLYTGPFIDEVSALKALHVIHNNINSNAYLIRLELDKVNGVVRIIPFVSREEQFFNGAVKKTDLHIHIMPKKIERISNNPPHKRYSPKNLNDKRRFFIGLSAGISMFSVSEKDIQGSIVLDTYPKDAGATYGVEVGYYMTDNIFATINYQRTDLNDIHFDNFFVSLNYKLQKMKVLSPYLGTIVGYNVMRWDAFPIQSTISNPSSTGSFFGLQIGDDIAIEKGLSFYMFYRYLWINNKTIIEIVPNQTEITYESEQSLNLGFKFSF